MTINFKGNDTRHGFPINITDDEVAEGDESIQLTLATESELEGVVPGINSTAEVIIVEDDCEFQIVCIFSILMQHNYV